MIASAPIHVATDWPAFGLFFLGLIGTFGGFTAWVLKRLDKNRSDWKGFVKQEIAEATAALKHEVSALAGTVDDNSRELREQGKAIARIEGALGSGLSAQPHSPLGTA